MPASIAAGRSRGSPEEIAAVYFWIDMHTKVQALEMIRPGLQNVIRTAALLAHIRLRYLQPLHKFFLVPLAKLSQGSEGLQARCFGRLRYVVMACCTSARACRSQGPGSLLYCIRCFNKQAVVLNQHATCRELCCAILGCLTGHRQPAAAASAVPLSRIASSREAGQLWYYLRERL